MSWEINAIFLIMAIVALLGNFLTVTLFMKKSSWLKRANCCLILALSIQDLLTGICMLKIPSFFQEQDAYPLPSSPAARVMFCSIIWSQYLPFALGVTPVYTCLMMTLERWLAVLKPTLFRKLEFSKKAIALLVLTPWLIGFGSEYAALIHCKPMKKNESYICTWKEVNSQTTRAVSATFTFLGMIFLPAILTVFGYIRVVLELRRIKLRVWGGDWVGHAKNTRSLMASKRVTWTAIFASSLVVVCWLPDQVHYALIQVRVVDINTPTHFAFKILAFANSCINPFIYSFSNSEYRRGFRELLCCRTPRRNGDNDNAFESNQVRHSVCRNAGKVLFHLSNKQV